MPDVPIIAPIQTDDFKIKLLEEKVLALKELMITVRRGDQKALELQAKEYERRLEALNHEADQLKEMQGRYVPREVYEKDLASLREEIKVNNDWRIKQEGQGVGKGAYSDMFKWLVPVLLTITFFLIMYFTRKQ